MNVPILILALLDIALIGALPRVFFRRGTLTAQWWLTASPFFADALILLAGIRGVVEPALPASTAREAAAAALCAASIFLIGATLGSHREPLSLWHQRDDAPRHLVTDGAYAWARHPFYAAFIVGLLGCAAAFPHWGTAAAFLFACVQLNRTAAREEATLLASPFGREYALYMARTGRFGLRFPDRRATSSARNRYVAARIQTARRAR